MLVGLVAVVGDVVGGDVVGGDVVGGDVVVVVTAMAKYV